MGCGMSSTGEVKEPVQATFLDRYELTDEEDLGKGGYSVVKKCVDKNSKLACAVKIITFKDANNDKEREIIHREVSILKKVTHKNIIKFYNYFEEVNKCYVVIELASGKDLFDRVLSKKHYSEKDARDLFLTLIKVIRYMHSLNIVHRDLKPENVLLRTLESDSDVILADFGFAIVSADNQLTERLGTPNYVAPEILRQQPYGKSVDIWALGVILFILLSGAYPFSETDLKSMFRKIARADYVFDQHHWAGVSDTAKDLIQMILVVEVQKRFSLDQILSHAWMLQADHELSNRKLPDSQGRIEVVCSGKQRMAGAAHAVSAAMHLQSDLLHGIAHGDDTNTKHDASISK